jgi:transposase-like protein
MSMAMEDEIKRWTAKRKSALVMEILQGKTTVAEASRAYVSVNPAAFFRRAFRSGEFLPSSIEHGRPGNGQGGNGALASA